MEKEFIIKRGEMCDSAKQLGEISCAKEIFEMYKTCDRALGGDVFLKKLWQKLEPLGDDGLRAFCVVAGWLGSSRKKVETILPADALSRIEVEKKESYSRHDDDFPGNFPRVFHSPWEL
ncbi:hypothetical protein HN954_03030 [bacterium]|jgi:hypothetical protein|nr:hypothetical protein [bacterium]MBT6832176.1 hypothetical protein [bacterium]MBT6996378.1 hypothetical protein [bacterium]MBT7772113.1 hypothetical protein [bacterium]